MHTCTPFFAGVFSHAVSMLQSKWKWKWKQTTITVYGFTFTRCVVLCCVFFTFPFLLLNECCVFVIFSFVFWSFFPVGKNRMGFHHCITAMHPRSFFFGTQFVNVWRKLPNGWVSSLWGIFFPISCFSSFVFFCAFFIFHFGTSSIMWNVLKCNNRILTEFPRRTEALIKFI